MSLVTCTRSFASALPLALVVSLASGCMISHRYRTDEVETIASLRGQRMVVPAAIDARDHGRPSAESSVSGKAVEDELREVRESVVEHVARTGVLETSDLAPTTPEEVRAVLAQAAAQRVEEVLFVRYHGANAGGVRVSFAALGLLTGALTWIILDSIPFCRQSATAGFEVFVVSSRTGEVLASSARLAAYGEMVSTWGFDPEAVMQEMMRRALQSALEDVASERVAGYPRRFRARDVLSFVIAAPNVRREGDALRGFGWRLRMPRGFELDRSVGPDGGARGPGGVSLYAEPRWCLGNPHECGEAAATLAQQAGDEVIEKREVDGRNGPERELEIRRANGTRAVQRITGIWGTMLAVTCEGDPNAVEQSLSACRAAFETAELSVTTRPE